MSLAGDSLGPPPVSSGIPRRRCERTTAPYQFLDYDPPAAGQARDLLDWVLETTSAGPRARESHRLAAVGTDRDTQRTKAAKWRILGVSDEDLATASEAVDTAHAHMDAALAALITARRELGMADGQLTTAEEKLEVLQVELAAARADDESEIRAGRPIDPAKVGRLRVKIDAQRRVVDEVRRVVGERKRSVDVARGAFDAASEVLAYNRHEHAVLAYHHAAGLAAADMLAKLTPALERVEDTMASVPFSARAVAQRQMRQCGERLLCSLGRIMPFEAIVAVVGGRPL